jgi:hypothetical protein
MAQFLQYYGNAVNVQATVVVGSGEVDLMDGGNPAIITEMKGLEIGINRTAIRGKNDWSDYQQIIDIETEPYTWTIRHRNQRAARLWFAAYHLKTLQFKLYTPCGDDYDRLWLRGCLVEDGNLDFQWGNELADMTISGTATMARIGDETSTWANADSLEGSLVLARDLTTANYETAADTVNRFDPLGLRNNNPPAKP